MKSLLISAVYFPPQVGGISRIMEYLARAMGRERLCCLTGVPAGPVPIDLGSRVYRSPTTFSDFSTPIRASAWARVLGTIMIRERPRAVLVGTVDDALYGRWFRRWLGLPYVVYTHGNEILAILGEEGSRADGSIAGGFLRGASRVVAVSRFTAGLCEQAGVDPSRIDVVNPGCDLDRFSPGHADPALRRRLLGDRPHDRVIVTTGNLVARKGHDMVIRALPRVREIVPDLTYLIVGDGPHRGELETLSTAVGVRDRVVFAGRAADADLARVYALADVFVMASRERREDRDVEGFGLVYLEASACGKPIIGGRSGGVPEAVVDGVTGLLVDPSDPGDIARALISVLTDPAYAARLGAGGRARVVREFTWARAADRMHAVLTGAADD
jgi:phosphatidylinositol alpha-1,6-mannosyltransferase